MKAKILVTEKGLGEGLLLGLVWSKRWLYIPEKKLVISIQEGRNTIDAYFIEREISPDKIKGEVDIPEDVILMAQLYADLGQRLNRHFDVIKDLIRSE